MTIDRMSKWILTREAATLLAVTRGRIHELVRQGRLRSRKLDGRTLAVALADVDAYRDSPRKAGRPPGS